MTELPESEKLTTIRLAVMTVSDWVCSNRQNLEPEV